MQSKPHNTGRERDRLLKALTSFNFRFVQLRFRPAHPSDGDKFMASMCVNSRLDDGVVLVMLTSSPFASIACLDFSSLFRSSSLSCFFHSSFPGCSTPVPDRVKVDRELVPGMLLPSCFPPLPCATCLDTVGLLSASSMEAGKAQVSLPQQHYPLFEQPVLLPLAG